MSEAVFEREVELPIHKILRIPDGLTVPSIWQQNFSILCNRTTNALCKTEVENCIKLISIARNSNTIKLNITSCKKFFYIFTFQFTTEKDITKFDKKFKTEFKKLMVTS